MAHDDEKFGDLPAKLWDKPLFADHVPTELIFHFAFILTNLPERNQQTSDPDLCVEEDHYDTALALMTIGDLERRGVEPRFMPWPLRLLRVGMMGRREGRLPPDWRPPWQDD